MAQLKNIVTAQLRHKQIHEVAISRLDCSAKTTTHAGGGTGNPDQNTPFYLASTTKLFATTLIMQLRKEKQLSLNDPITAFFEPGKLASLHVLNGTDHTDEITIRHLLCHSSGLPDYFEGKRKDGTRFAEAMLSGMDGAFDLDEVLQSARNDMRPHFPPGEGRKAVYSDTNFQLLGGILETITSQSLPDLVHTKIAAPLGLTRTFLATPASIAKCKDLIPLRNQDKQLSIPHALSSTRLDGAGISTSAELLRFTEAFHKGDLFPAEYVPELTADFRKIFFPLTYGTGVIRFRLPWIFDPMRKMPVVTGHSGISGAFAYYAADRDTCIAGTLNQLANRSLPYRFMLQAL